MQSFTFNTSKSIICECGAIARLAGICQSVGISRPLIVTDAGIVNIGLLAPVESALGDMAFASFYEVVADPPEAVIHQALAAAKAHQADGIIGFGGGSSLDTAKLVALMAKSGESLEQIYGVDQAKGQRLP